LLVFLLKTSVKYNLCSSFIVRKMEPHELKLTLLLGVTFIFGFAVGYKAKEWRIRWTKRKRDVLATQLKKAQKELEMLTTH
jgi:uncharacterized membrane protein YciS (DUF1049 family)